MRCSRDIAAPLPSGAVAPQVLEYYDKLKPQCIAKPEPYAERKKRREAEIAGLKEALTILEEEAGSAFLPMFILTLR